MLTEQVLIAKSRSYHLNLYAYVNAQLSTASNTGVSLGAFLETPRIRLFLIPSHLVSRFETHILADCQECHVMIDARRIECEFIFESSLGLETSH